MFPFDSNYKHKLLEKNINRNEFLIFERNLTKWLSENSTSLSYEELGYFKNSTITCLTSGVTFGFLTHFFLSRFKLIPNTMTRKFTSAFAGLYASAYTLNKLRKNIYLNLLDSTGPAGIESRKILKLIKETSNVIYQPVTNGNDSETNPTYLDRDNRHYADAVNRDRDLYHSSGNYPVQQTNTYSTTDNRPDMVQNLYKRPDSNNNTENKEFVNINFSNEEKDLENKTKYKTWEDIRRESNKTHFK